MTEQAPRSSRWAALLAVLAIGGSAAGALVYMASQRDQPAVSDISGFDLDNVAGGPAKVSARAAPVQDRSGLGMITGAVPGMKTGQAVSGQPSVAARFQELTRASEKRIELMARRYSAKFPIVRQYGRDWMSHPDLKKLNDNYMKNHDPIAFMKGAAASPNFAKMLKAYATQKPIQDFVKESVQTAPPGAVATALDYVKTEKNVNGLVGNVAKNLGIPAAFLTMGAGEPSKIDEKQVMQQVLSSNPELQKHLQNQPR